MTYTFIAQRCSDLPVAACCRAMRVSTSGFYAWQANPVSDRDWHDANLTNTAFDIHRMSRRSYGSPRVHAELVLGQGQRCSRKRVARLMAQAGIVGIHRRKFRGCTRRDPDDLAAVASALNGRPRKTLGWKTPAEALDYLLQSNGQGRVATTR
jgi:putative transposase